MKALLAFMSGIMIASATHAATVGVRSGEHAGFSRLVLNFDASGGWELGRVDGGWEFRATDTTIAFDTREVFDRIPRTRLLRLESPGKGVLRLVATCECHVRAFWFTGNRVVIDLLDGAAATESPFDALLPPLSSNKRLPSGPEAIDKLARAIEYAAINGYTGRGDPDFNSMTRTTSGARDAARQFEERLREQLARAAGQGLVAQAPASEKTIAGEPPDPYRPKDTGHDTDRSRAPREENTAARAGVHIETAIDRESPSGRYPDGPGTEIGAPCPDPALLDLPAWGRAGEAANVSKFRAKLADISEDFDAQSALALARYYIFLGFGAEAKEVVSLIGSASAATDIISAMSEIVDADGENPSGFTLDGFEACDSAAALWAVLAGPVPLHGQDVNEFAVTRSFRDFPPHIRTLLGPPLASRLIAAGRVETASIIRNMMNLAGAGANAATALANAEVDLATGDRKRAEAGLDAALVENDPGAAKALLLLAELRLAAGDLPDPAHLGALGAIADEQAGTNLARRIEVVDAETLIRQGDFLAARDVIRSRLLASGDPDTNRLLRSLYTQAALRAESAVFLRLVLPALDGLANTYDDMVVRQTIAERLISLGFAENARNILEFTGDERTPPPVANEDGASGALEGVNRFARGEALPGQAGAWMPQGEVENTHASLRAADTAVDAPLSNVMASELPDPLRADAPSPGDREEGSPHSGAPAQDAVLDRVRKLIEASRADRESYSTHLAAR